MTPRPEPTFRNLLVPLDGSRMAEAVLPVAAEFARRFGARLTLLHVLEHDAPETVHGEAHLSDAPSAEAYLARTAESLAADVALVHTHVHLNLERDVAGSVVGHAGELENDLVILATHGRSDLKDVLIGSIAELVLARGSTPVLLIRPESVAPGQPFAIQKVLVPLDGSADSERALPVAEAVARAWSAEVSLLRVVHTTSTLPGERAAVASMLPSATSAALRLERALAEEYLAARAKEMSARGIATSVSVLRGHPAPTVLSAVRRQGADFVVMATHGRSGLDAFWAGSVGHRLAERLTVPLLIVRSERLS